MDFGWTENEYDSHWPQEETMFKFPSYRRIKLSALHYKHMNNSDQLCGIQFEFTGGVRGPMLETTLAKET